MNEIIRMRQEGLTISDIARLLQIDRKTVRKYLADPRPRAYRRQVCRGSLLEPFVDYIQTRLAQNVWNAVVLFAELKARGYTGSYTSVKAYLHPLRKQAKAVAVRRFETPPGRQAQVDWVVLGDIHTPEGTRPLYGFVFTLGYSRAMYVEATTDTSLRSFLQLHERAFSYLGGVPQEILYDNDGMVVVPSAWHQGQPTLQPDLVVFAEHHGYRVRLCRPYRPQTKGKTERGIGYVRQNFLCGRSATNLDDLNTQCLVWLQTVANVRVHGTTNRAVGVAWEEEKPFLGAFVPLPAHLWPRLPLRQVSRDGFVRVATNCYSVPWQLAGTEVFVRQSAGRLDIFRDEVLVARHALCQGRYQKVEEAAHRQGMPYGPSTRQKKAKIHLAPDAPVVDARDLGCYEEVAA